MLRKWFLHYHGGGAENQVDLYRCNGCGKIVTHANIADHGGCLCGNNRVSPTNPTWKEAIGLVVIPWMYR